MLHVTPIPAFRDNYIWALHHAYHALLVDPGDAEPCIQFLEQHNLNLIAILNTHHHHDHLGGNMDLRERYHPQIYGPAESMPAVTRVVKDGDRLAFPQLDTEFTVISTPGHTLGHLAYLAPGKLFCGDTLFSCGCGRLFEGTPAMMLDSLRRISSLPDDTQIFCAHEYTLTNMSFALTVDPENDELQRQVVIAREKRRSGTPTLPTVLSLEKAINPFLRCQHPALLNAASTQLGHPARDELETFAQLRLAKDQF